jgi:hypothetical protein
VGIPEELQTLIHRGEVVGEIMTSRLPPGPGGPLAGGEPLYEKGPRGGAQGAP